MSGQMAWMPKLGSKERVLHLRFTNSEHWMPYTSSPLAVPDHEIPNGTKGWATYQKLLDAGWSITGEGGTYLKGGVKVECES